MPKLPSTSALMQPLLCLGLGVAWASCKSSTFSASAPASAQNSGGSGSGFNTSGTSNDGGSAANGGGSGAGGTAPGALGSASNGAGPCGAAGSTQAKLLTPSLANADPQNLLAYELFVTDCSGNRKSVDANAIMFDIDAFLLGVPESQPLVYVVKSADNSVTGQLIRVSNSDLFGKTGPTFFHFETDKPFSLATAASSVTITIRMAGRSFKPYSAPATGNYAQVQTYLRFGAAIPVTNVVQLTGQSQN